jgi:hypothetical protein
MRNRLKTLPTKQDVRTLRAVEKFDQERFCRLKGVDPVPCLRAGWIVASEVGYVLMSDVSAYGTD